MKIHWTGLMYFINIFVWMWKHAYHWCIVLCFSQGSGDVYCHFKIHKYKLGGYVTLQSMKHRGVFIGLNTNGKAKPTVDTGDVNTQFTVEVIKCKSNVLFQELINYRYIQRRMLSSALRNVKDALCNFHLTVVSSFQ